MPVEPVSKGIIFNIQKYSIHDGPGIRTTVFLKGCPLKCFWCQNPESQKRQPEVFFVKSECTRCGKCVAVCPSKASSLLKDSSTIDRSQCIGCGECVKVCPGKARRLVGSYVTTAQVMQEVLKDMKFYQNSGGGITLCGGEPTAQPAFALSLLRSCKDAGLHTLLNTCGHAPWSTLKRLLEYTDLVFFDIKIIDKNKHRRATGRFNNLILDNARRIAAFKPIRVRVPVIPGYNDTPEEIRAIAHFVKENMGSTDIDLLPYNKLGEVKYERLGRTYVPLTTISEDSIHSLENIVKLEIKNK